MALTEQQNPFNLPRYEQVILFIRLNSYQFCCLTFRTTVAIDNSLSTPEEQNFIGIWLDRNCHENAYALVKRALHDFFNSLEVFTHFDKCTMYINQPRPAKIFFIVSHEIGDKLIPLMLLQETVPVEHIYVYCTKTEEQDRWNISHSQIRGGYITIESLMEQIKSDSVAFNQLTKADVPTSASFMTPPSTASDKTNPLKELDDELVHHRALYAVPSTMVLDRNIKKTSIKDLSKDYLWFIQFQLLVKILIRLEYSEQAKKDIVSVCRQYYENNDCEQRKITKFEGEADNLSRIIYWYTAESFLIHLLNQVCSTEDVDHLYCFRLIISNLHKRIVELEKDKWTIDFRKKKTLLYRGKRMNGSTFENLRKSVGSIVAMKGFLSTTTDAEVAKVYAGYGIEQPGSACVLFKLNIDKWEECKPSVAINPEESAIKDEQEALFSIGSLWKIMKIEQMSGKNALEE